MSRGRKSRRRREQHAEREQEAAQEQEAAREQGAEPPSEPAGNPPPPADPQPTLPRRALSLLGRYDLVILLCVGIAVAVYLGLPDDDEEALPAPALDQPGVTTGPDEPPSEEASRDEGGRDQAQRPATPEETFAHSCGTCHSLEAAGTEGITGPDLDQVEPSAEQVLRFIRTGSLDGVMPPNLLRGEKAEQVAEYIARTAGDGA